MRNVACNHAPGADDAAFTDRYTTENDRTRANPSSSLNFDRSLKIGSMAPNELLCIELRVDHHATGRENDLISNFYSAPGVQENSVINCAILPDRNPPVIDGCEIAKNMDAAPEQEESLCLIQPPR